MEQEVLTSEETRSEEEIDFVKEFETDIFLRTQISVPGEDSPNRIPSFAHGHTAYQTIAEADTLSKNKRPQTSKKA